MIYLIMIGGMSVIGKEERLEVFQQLTACCYNIWNWKYDTQFNVIESNCPHELLFDQLFLSEGRRKTIDEHMRKCHVPIVYTASAILSWIIAFERLEDSVTAIYVKGPFFKGFNDEKSYSDILKPLCLDKETESTLRSDFQSLPMLTSSSIIQFAIMLHYSLNAETISASEVLPYSTKESKHKKPGKILVDQFEGTNGYWNTEQELLYKVRNGDLNYRDIIERASVLSNWKYDGDKMNVDYYRQHLHVLLTLVSRAAVEGSLPRKISFSLCSEYRRMLNRCYTISGLHQISDVMLSDYIQRVHEMKELSTCPSPIRMCCAYIDTHPGEKLTLEFLAKKVGYSVYYLSRKFEQEVGISITDYICNKRLEKAKYMLTSTNLRIEKISEVLGFGSRSYFTSIFSKNMGMTPSAYRRSTDTI
jgi:AraC-like DNA-binding protein